MASYEVPQPILNSPYAEPRWHWWIEEGRPCEKRAGRRPLVYYYRPPHEATGADAGSEVGTAIEMTLVNLIRERVRAWREAGWPGVTRTTEELLRWWQREGRQFPLFFAQREAAETIIFLTEARADFRQGLEIPRDDPSEEKKAQGYPGFTRYACKMATGSGKTTVMGMLAAWSILNKVHNRSDGRFSDVVFVVCPNITIRDRLQELDPKRGEASLCRTRDLVPAHLKASLYRTRDLVPAHLMPKLNEGFVVVTNWHVLEPQQGNQVGGVGAAVVKRAVEKDSTSVASL
jgi:type III restriction enzyme